MTSLLESVKNKVVRWSRIKSPWVVHFNSGACNGCDIEVLAALMPRFDVERFGILLKGTPRHADVLVTTGAVTRQQEERLRTIWEQMPEPKFCIAVGNCACDGCVFRNCYNVVGGTDRVVPVHMDIPGCAVRPDAIIDGVVKLLSKL